jgi:isocitrate dehydrogenase (NAD+)
MKCINYVQIYYGLIFYILSNIAAGLVGGPGVVPGMNLGEDYAVFELVYIYL